MVSRLIHFVFELIYFLKNSVLVFGAGVISIVHNSKTNFVYNLFWGRGNLYRQILHMTFATLTAFLVITGISFEIGKRSNIQGFAIENESVIGNIDLLQQGSGIQTVLRLEGSVGFRIFTHVIKEGDTIESLVQEYGVNSRTIKDSNRGAIDYWTNQLRLGKTLFIPEANGVLYEVGEGDTLNKILAKVENGTLFESMEVNAINDPDAVLKKGDRILMPNATLPEPPKPIPKPGRVIANAPFSSESIQFNVAVKALNGINFVDPLSHPWCSGYVWQRGFTEWHTGVDLSKSGGCPIRAIADGVVLFAGWSNGPKGYYIKIDHGSGVVSEYFHGDGNIWVRPGDKVYEGQEIMYMGCTGRCTGTHLHLELVLNGQEINPSLYVPYYRPF
jgi:murein DD-endopeptidase MepM/ murein hydrolase activator NlpD